MTPKFWGVNVSSSNSLLDGDSTLTSNEQILVMYVAVTVTQPSSSVIGSRAFRYSDHYCQSTCLSVVCHSVCLSVCPHFQNASSPAVLVGIS